MLFNNKASHSCWKRSLSNPSKNCSLYKNCRSHKTCSQRYNSCDGAKQLRMSVSVLSKPGQSNYHNLRKAWWSTRIFCKVLKLSETKIVGQAKYNVANATIADNTGQITLDVWNNLIPQIQENKVYKFTNLSVRFWNGIRKLTTTTNSVILETPNPLLESLQVEDTSNPHVETTILLSRIESIESVEKYKICGHCAKRIIQVQGLLVSCDHCHHKLRASSCPTKLSASIVVKNESTKL